jgi:hypothetical protein
MEVDNSAREFETVRIIMIDGQPFIVAKYIPLDIRKQLRSSNKEFLKLLLTESPGLAESTLEQKVNDFAARNGNGLCGGLVAECLAEAANPDCRASDDYGPSDLTEYPTLDCMHLIENESDHGYHEFLISAYERTSELQHIPRVYPNSRSKDPKEASNCCFDFNNLPCHAVLKTLVQALQGVVPSLAKFIIAANDPSLDIKDRLKAEQKSPSGKEAALILRYCTIIIRSLVFQNEPPSSKEKRTCMHLKLFLQRGIANQITKRVFQRHHDEILLEQMGI